MPEVQTATDTEKTRRTIICCIRLGEYAWVAHPEQRGAFYTVWPGQFSIRNPNGKFRPYGHEYLHELGLYAGREVTVREELPERPIQFIVDALPTSRIDRAKLALKSWRNMRAYWRNKKPWLTPQPS